MLDTNKVNNLILSVIEPRFEDTIQEVWVRIIEEHIDNEDDVLRIAKDINHEYSRKSVEEKYKFVSLDDPTPINDTSFDEPHQTFKDVLTYDKLEDSKIKLGRYDIALIQARNKRHKNQELGLCPCGKNPLNGYKRCQQCLDKDKSRYDIMVIKNNYRRNLNRKLGLCVVCGQLRKEGANQRKEPYVRCPHCLNIARRNIKIYHAKHPRVSGKIRTYKLRKEYLIPTMAQLRQQGFSWCAIGEQLKLGHMTVYRYKELISKYIYSQHGVISGT